MECILTPQKTQIMTNSEGKFTSEIKINNEPLKIVDTLKYLGEIIDDKGSNTEIKSRTGQAVAALSKLNMICNYKALQQKLKIKLMLSLFSSLFVYECETWTITNELQGTMRAIEMRCLRRLLNITYRERITNIEVRSIVTREICPHSELLAIVITKKLKWFGHVIRSNTMYKTLLQGTIDGKRRRAPQEGPK